MFNRSHSLSERLDALDRAAESGGAFFTPEQHAAITRVRESAAARRALSAEHTVVGFFGATGSGKTSLFNAVVGEDLGASSPRRPTTSAPLAAVWHPEGSSALLDWLDVEDRRNRPGDFAPKAGPLILLDLPDFDSVEASNRAIATRLAGQVDVLVWVTDPENTRITSSTTTLSARTPRTRRLPSRSSTRRTSLPMPTSPPSPTPSPSSCARTASPRSRSCPPPRRLALASTTCAQPSPRSPRPTTRRPSASRPTSTRSPPRGPTNAHPRTCPRKPRRNSTNTSPPPLAPSASPPRRPPPTASAWARPPDGCSPRGCCACAPTRCAASACARPRTTRACTAPPCRRSTPPGGLRPTRACAPTPRPPRTASPRPGPMPSPTARSPSPISFPMPSTAPPPAPACPHSPRSLGASSPSSSGSHSSLPSWACCGTSPRPSSLAHSRRSSAQTSPRKSRAGRTPHCSFWAASS
ncbi:GTPase [Corynebacterium phoceense]|uniref:GTPase n=1 Tax=Corynebacterium phoceense TaxID=1686286 RepID=UPI002852E462|nr:GTPase [Corynebacterium phoceense]